MGHLGLTMGYHNHKATVVHIRVTLGYLRVTINYRLFFSISKHEANTTELHPKVRQTCLYLSAQVTKDDSQYYV